MRFAASAVVAILAALLTGCAAGGQKSAADSSGASSSQAQREVYLAPNGVGFDLITPDGIHVKTNDQYKTSEQRHSASAAIDRYWSSVKDCTLQMVPPGDTLIVQKLLPEFPSHLSIEISDNWQIVEGHVTHRKQQAFPSLRKPGAFITATREEDSLMVEVVPELNGLGRQMAGAVNIWLSGHTDATSTDLSNVCAALPCYRFRYDNAPSQAWENCTD
jgi:hypothetical protein